METRIVTNYSRSLFDAALSEKKVDKVLKDLDLFYRLFCLDGRLSQVMKSPIISAGIKAGIIKAMAKKYSLDALMVNFLNLLAKNKRFSVLEKIVPAFHKLLDEHNGIVTVTVTTAEDITKAHETNLSKSLQKFTGKKIRIDHTVDTSIIGGIVIRVDDKIIDNSIKGHLGRLKKQLLPRAGL